MVPSTRTMDSSKRKSREEDATSPVIADYQKKRKIECAYDNTNSNPNHTNDDHGHDVVGETELASAFALASLASFSPQSTNHESSRPEAREAGESEEDDDYGEEEESMASLEARSPKEEPTPITPDARSPIRPHHQHVNNNNKRVTFAPNIKNHERLTARRFSIPSSSPAARGSRMPLGFRRVPSSRGPIPMPWVRQHRMMVPPPPPPPPGFLPPPAMMMPTSSPPLPHSSSFSSSSSNQWICDFCNVASFATYEEACLHEEACSLRCNIAARPPPPMWHPHVSHTIPMQPSLRFPPPPEERFRDTPPLPQPLPSASSRTWFTGATFLAVPESDAEWLSELNCFIRTTCVEAFSATAEHVSRTSKRGRITLNQVGIRCAFCAHRKPDDKVVASVSFPTSVSGIYESVKRWQRDMIARHFKFPASQE